MTDKNNRKTKLKSALRDNLKKRKDQARKFKSDEEGDGFSMKLRSREIAKKP